MRALDPSTRRSPFAPDLHFSPPVFLTLCLLTIALSAIGGGVVNHPETGVHDFWLIPGTFYLTIIATWPRAHLPTSRTFVTVQVAGIALATIVSALCWTSLGWAALHAVGSWLGAFTTAYIYRRSRGGLRSWLPSTGWGVTTVLLASVVGAVVAALIGGIPGATPADWMASPEMAASCLWRAQTGLTVTGTATVQALFADTPDGRRSAPRSVAVLAVTMCVAGSVLAVASPRLSLAWLVPISACIANVVLSRRASGWLLLVTTALLMYPSYTGGHVPDGLPAMSFDPLLSFTCVLAFFVGTNRAQRTRLASVLARRERAEHARSQLLSAVLEATTDGFIVMDRQGRVIRHNTAAGTLAGRPIPDQIGIEWITELDMHRVGHEEPINAALLIRGNRAASVTEQVEDLLLVHPGASTPVVLNMMRQPLLEDRSPMTLITFKDRTADVARHQQLEAFAGTIAHDLKGPLTALKGWMDAAADELEDDGGLYSSREALVRARTASLRMRTIIDDYLAFTIAREGQLQLADIPLRELVQELAEVYAGHERGVTFEVDTPHTVRADPSLTRQLLANIVSNSVKYARPGQPVLIEVTSLPAGRGWVEVVVSDDGVGIQPGDEEKIFGAYARSDKDASSFQGIGLGLSLCHAIVKRHGGHISASGNDRGGATIYFTLPAAVNP